jgi:uncharacterized protein
MNNLSAGFEKKFRLNILQQSPLDQCGGSLDKTPAPAPPLHWVPSRFNVRATDENGRLILWNSLSSAMSVFRQDQAPEVAALLKAPGFESAKEGIAGYLAERGFLVKRGTDEYRKFLLAFGQQHYRTDRLELILLASEDCNFRCTYCYEDFARGTMLPEVRQGIKRLVERRIEKLRVLDIRWFGGEPLYGMAAIEDLAPFFSEITKKHEVISLGHMTTNGYLLTPNVASKLFSWGVNSFQITLDGVPETHNHSRPTRDGQGTFATIFENLKAMAKRPDPFFVGVRVNFDQSNRPHLERMLDLLKKEFGGDSRFGVNFHAVGKWGGENDGNLEVCGADERAQVMTEMKALAHQRGLGVTTLRDMNYMGSQVCYAARPFNLLIGASGKVMKCTVVLDKDDNNVVGHLREDGQLEVDDDKMALWTEPAFQRDDQCQKCAVLPSCQGISCPLPRIQKDERPCIPTRTSSKTELREAVRLPRRAARTRDVTQTNSQLRERG